MTPPIENDRAAPAGAFWAGKRVFVTGHTGFKGSWLALWLTKLGARVHGYALAPEPGPSLFRDLALDREIDHGVADIRDTEALRRGVEEIRPEIVFHLAAQPLVRASYRDPLGTFSTNILGTANLLDAVRGVDSVRVVVVVTTDKVYRNNEWVWPYRETDMLGGHDPYSASKAGSEIVVDCYRQSFLAAAGIAVSSARAGNVIGGGDWSKDRLIPDAIRAWTAGQPLVVRNPEATRPWQHVLDPLRGYLRIAEKTWSAPALAGAFNLGPASHEAATVRQVVELAKPVFPDAVATWSNEGKGPHEARWLALDTAKARQTLGLKPVWQLGDTVLHTMEWYREHISGTPSLGLCSADIEAFTKTAH
jgi:CDP-glucose 4,6-dehydratase